IVLPRKAGDNTESVTIEGSFKLGQTTVKHTFTVPLHDQEPLELVESREVAFKNMTTEYTVPESNVTLFFEEGGFVPYIKVKDFFDMVTGFIDPEVEFTWTTEENTLEIYYQYYLLLHHNIGNRFLKCFLHLDNRRKHFRNLLPIL